MTLGEFILAGMFGVFVLPVLSYMIVKFGTAGYFRAKQRETNKQKQKAETNE